ncbi:uncharacterized protein LOC143566493 [Bidens hawaiensis]|uniref:uncharacterized protein LOC143566493 n=1 Tax=Bidens hawaiensis TaxID=980011 RepID=UPI00404AF9CF
MDWKLAKPILLRKFESSAQLKDMLIDYGVANSHQLVFTVNDHARLLVRCGTEEIEDDGNGRKKKVWKCSFRLWASRIKGDDSFQIKSLNDNHTCSRKFHLGSLVTYSWIAKRYFKKIIKNPEISLREMQKDIMKKYQCRVSTGQCDRAKQKVLNDYEGGLKEHYARLSDYQAELLETNPEIVKDGWISGCRKVICLDGCFLKNSGPLLSAVGRDANNHIFPLAWAVVSVENKENWTWFHNLLRDDIEMEGGHGLTLVSDQHKGIIEAVKGLFPNAEHRQCTRHIYANFIKKFCGLQSKNLFWKAANSTSKQWFERHMEELKTSSKGAYDHLMERNPITWSRAFFKVGRACNAFENGMSESFNSRIQTARRKPTISMFEDIRRFVMRIIHYDVIPSGNNIFEIRSEKSAYVVKIQEQTCTCGSWQLSGIPCVHTIAALAFLNINPKTYVNPWFKKGMFKEAYKHCIKPVKGSMHWSKTNDIKPLPPKERRMPGRPPVKRKLETLWRKRIKTKKLELEEK